MATWTDISNAAVAVGGIPSSSTVTALRDNPTALAETASGAPVVFAGWHPYDKVTVGDGKTGLIYDHAVNGTVASVITPDFVDGYEYRVIATAIECNSGSNTELELDGFYETDSFYKRIRYSNEGVGTSHYFGCDLEILVPRIPNVVHLVKGLIYRDGSISSGNLDSDSYELPAQKLLRARVAFKLGSISGGKIWMFRRREYASLP